MKRGARLLAGLLLAVLLPAAQALQWPGIRDGALHLRVSRDDQLQVSWQPAWQAEANAEQLFLQSGDGRLLAQRDILPDEPRGALRWALPAGAGDYRVEVPGYSFRRYRFGHAETSAALFEPAKLHVSAELPSGMQFYFRVPAGTQALLGGKYHGGIRRLELERLGDGLRLQLTLQVHDHYADSDQLALPVTAAEQVWRLRPQGSGKAAFWLDGSANLFAQRPEHLFSPAARAGQVALQLHAERLGRTPWLGVALPYTPPEAPELLARLAPRAANHYTFADVLERRPDHEQAFRPLYRHRYAIAVDSTLLALTGRRSRLDADARSRLGLQRWVAGIRGLGVHGRHYLAFADEPNLNYPDYPSFAGYFAAMLAEAQAIPGLREAGVRIAVPASSRLLNGPLRDGAAERRGIDWARRLLAEHGEAIDALSWHEWMVRDLRATRVYREQVRQAAQLVGLDAQGRPRKALLLEQTNLSSGASVSPYEQATHFAALWWASVAANAAQDGLLELLNWFPATDDPHHRKGMIATRDGTQFRLKPVGQAMAFMQAHWLDEVLRLDNDAFEVDALAMASGAQRALFGVNKAPRRQQVRLRGALPGCAAHPAPQLLLLDAPASAADGTPHAGAVTCQADTWQFELPGEVLFVLRWQHADG